MKEKLTTSKLVFDIEADGLYDTVTKVHCIVTQDLETGEVKRYHDSILCSADGSIREALRALTTADLIVGHNIIDYDIPTLQKLYPDFNPQGTVRDTLLLTQLIWGNLMDLDNNRLKKSGHVKFIKDGRKFKTVAVRDHPLISYRGKHSLKAWGIRLKCFKGDYGDTSDWSTFSKEMLDYCVQDVEVSVTLYNRILKENYPEQPVELEHKLAKIMNKQKLFGWLLDKDKAYKLQRELEDKSDVILQEVQAIFGGWTHELKTPERYHATVDGIIYEAQTKGALSQLLWDKYKGLGLFKRVELNAKIEAGANRVKHIPFNPASRQHIAKAFKEKYDWETTELTDKGSPRLDDEVIGKLKFPEAKPLARWLLLNKRLAQLAEGNQAWLKVVKDDDRIHGSINIVGAVTGRATHSYPNVAQVPSIKAEYGAECRELFTVRKGYKLVGADASGLELRCLAHYMAKHDAGSYAHEVVNGDVHTRNQEAAGLPTRDNAKTFIYGFLYGAGNAKIGEIVGKGSQAGARLRKRFLSKLPALKKLQEAVQAKAATGFLRAIDGRILPIRSPHSALNALLQGAGAIVCKVWLVNLYETLISKGYVWGEDFAFVGWIHDEVQIEVREDLAEDIARLSEETIREVTTILKFRCPLDGEAKIGNNWKDTH